MAYGCTGQGFEFWRTSILHGALKIGGYTMCNPLDEVNGPATPQRGLRDDPERPETTNDVFFGGPHRSPTKTVFWIYVQIALMVCIVCVCVKIIYNLLNM